MMTLLVLAAQLAGAPVMPAPPQDWTALRPLPVSRDADDNADVSGFVRSEVHAGRCAAATQSPTGWVLKVDLAVFLDPNGLPRRIVPRAISCPSVEQYAAGLVSSLARGSVTTGIADTGGWYRTSLTFSWSA